jgi:hypothetical protein
MIIQPMVSHSSQNASRTNQLPLGLMKMPLGRRRDEREES